MKTVRAAVKRRGRPFVSAMTAIAVLLGGCTPAVEKPVAPPVITPPPQVGEKFRDGWPDGTPGLGNHTLRFVVSGQPDKVLSNDGTGYLIVRSKRTSDVARIVFRNNTTAVYRLPGHAFEIHAIGADHICRNTGFSLDTSQDGKEIDIGIVADQDSSTITMKSEGRFSFHGHCRTRAGWERHFAKQGISPEPRDASVEAKIAGAVLGLILLLPICVASGGALCNSTGLK